MELTDRGRLERVLGGADTARLRDRVRERLARGLELTGSITLSDPSPAERAAVERLLGRRPGAGRSVSIPLATLDETLRSSGIHPHGLAGAIAELAGPVVVRSDERSAVNAAWEDAAASLSSLAAARPELTEWFRDLIASGLLKRVTGSPDTAASVGRRVCEALAALPAAPIPASEFAALHLGNAHALDEGNPVSTLVFGAARVLGGAPDGTGAGWRRMVWESVGLLRDELTSTALALGLRADPGTATGRAVAGWGEDLQPAVLTLRQLRTEQVEWRPGATVFVCENPSVIAVAADRLDRSAPLVCTFGQPGAAVLMLLAQLTAAGAQLRYHGDFDWYGIRIANFVRRHRTWEPWRFGAGDYVDACSRNSGVELIGSRVVASWDPELDLVMSEHARQVEEEQVFDLLLADLAIG